VYFGRSIVTRTASGHRQNTKTSTAIQTERKTGHGATEEEMEEPTSSGGSSNRLTRLNFHEHDDDDDDDDDDEKYSHVSKKTPSSPRTFPRY
jgi:hypothetical protein